jgi:TPP-dependent pyruvate/acetoin dehydrogenase alpha subunit
MTVQETSPAMNAALYRQLYRIRRTEEEIARIYPSDKIKSPVHLSIGQEFVSVGIAAALERGDAAFGTYRGHALYLAMGGDLGGMMAELYGKSTGCAGGKGGSMHLIAKEQGFYGSSAVVGTTIPHAVGCALAFHLRGQDRVALSMFGDGAVEEGVFWESLNFAVIRQLPVLFVCENNFYAIHSGLHQRQPATTITRRVEGFGLPCRRVESGDVHEVIAAAKEAVAAIRRGEGPQFLEVLAYRWKEHVGPNEDWAAGYRSEQDIHPWRERDAVRVVGDALPPEERRAVEAAVEAEIAAAIDLAEESPWPPLEALVADVWAEGT